MEGIRKLRTRFSKDVWAQKGESLGGSIIILNVSRTTLYKRTLKYVCVGAEEKNEPAEDGSISAS